MGWLDRFLGAKRALIPGPPATTALECLNSAGWRPGRTCDITVVEQTLRNAGFELHEPARRFLGEYYGLAIDVPISGATGVKGFVHFVPEIVIRQLGPGDLTRLQSLMPRSACPIGTTSGHTMYLFLDEYGQSYLLDREWSIFAPLAITVDDTVQVLCDGRNGRVDGHILDEQGKPNGEVIRADDERRHWQLDQFSGIERFLPPVSLSPARRPPTWRAMVRVVEQSLANGAEPTSLMVTCGGIAVSPSGELLFVAHCENCLFVRSKAGFQVSGPPPGIASRLRIGEVIPLQRPTTGATG